MKQLSIMLFSKVFCFLMLFLSSNYNAKANGDKPEEQITAITQHGESQSLRKTVENLQDELKHCKNESFFENLVKTELQALFQKSEERIKSELRAIISKILYNQTQEILKNQAQLTSFAANSVIARINEWDENFNCTGKCGPINSLPQSCRDAVSTYVDGHYLLNIHGTGLKPFYAYCEVVNNKVMMVIQRREAGSVDFNRNWYDYKHGFGNLYGDFWFGLERLHELTTLHKNELYFWFENENGDEGIVHCTQVTIANEAEKYEIQLEGCSDNYEETLNILNGTKFSTFDNCNNGKGETECAKSIVGGWWLRDDLNSSLNGAWKNLHYTRMAIRRPWE